MSFVKHTNTYVKILTGKYRGQYGKAGYSNSDMDLVEVFPLKSTERVLLDTFQGIEVVKCPATIETIKILYKR